jgi:DNA-binding transcriptional regulator YiaG
MSPRLETTTNRSLSSQAQEMSTAEDRLPSSISYSIGSAIFTSYRSTTVTAQVYDLDLLAVLNMTTSGVKLHLAIPQKVLAKLITAECTNYLQQDATVTTVAKLPVKSTQQAVNELRKLSGLTWDQLAILFDVSRRSVHFWASGQPLTSANEEKLNRILDVLEHISRGSASRNRSLLMSIADDGKSYLDLITAGEYDRVKHLLGAGNAPKKPKLGQLSQAAEMARMPPNPVDLVDILQDSIHHEVDKSSVVKSVRSRNK